MELKITTSQILKLLQVLAWIIFIGLCIEAGAIATNTIITLFFNPAAAGYFWEGKTYFSNIYQLDHGYFMVVTVIMIIVAVLKSIMFYIIIKLFVNKHLNLQEPFSGALRQFILNISYLSIGIGLFANAGMKYTNWLIQQGAPKADLQALHFTGGDVWLFMAVILLVIAQIVKRGIEIQNENNLTI